MLLKTSEKLALKNYIEPYTRRGYPITLINKGFELAERYHKKNYGTRKITTTKKP